jgi:hypothetical protein
MTFTGPMSLSSCGASPSWIAWLSTLAPMRLRKPKPLLPMATVWIVPPADCTSFILFVTARNTLVLRPPHRPLSVVTTMKPTALLVPPVRMYGDLYSGLPSDRCAVMLRILSA